MPRISVIVPVYNAEPYIHRCVDSILAQTCTDFELILVDDGSPDNCGAICDEYAKKDSRIHVIHQANGGVSLARNAGLDWVFDNSSSEYVAFIDSDDWIHPKYFEILIKVAAETGADGITINNYWTDQEIQSEPYQLDSITYQIFDAEYIQKNLYSLIFDSRYKDIITCGLYGIYRRNCFRECRFLSSIKIGEDLLMMGELNSSINKVAHVDLPLYYYFTGNASATRSEFSTSHITYLYASYALIQLAKQKRIDSQACFEYRYFFDYTDLALKAKNEASLWQAFSSHHFSFKRSIGMLLKNKYMGIDDKVLAIGMALHLPIWSKIAGKYESKRIERLNHLLES